MYSHICTYLKYYLIFHKKNTFFCVQDRVITNPGVSVVSLRQDKPILVTGGWDHRIRYATFYWQSYKKLMGFFLDYWYVIFGAWYVISNLPGSCQVQALLYLLKLYIWQSNNSIIFQLKPYSGGFRDSSYNVNCETEIHSIF